MLRVWKREPPRRPQHAAQAPGVDRGLESRASASRAMSEGKELQATLRTAAADPAKHVATERSPPSSLVQGHHQSCPAPQHRGSDPPHRWDRSTGFLQLLGYSRRSLQGVKEQLLSDGHQRPGRSPQPPKTFTLHAEALALRFGASAGKPRISASGVGLKLRFCFVIFQEHAHTAISTAV